MVMGKGGTTVATIVIALIAAFVIWLEYDALYSRPNDATVTVAPERNVVSAPPADKIPAEPPAPAVPRAADMAPPAAPPAVPVPAPAPPAPPVMAEAPPAPSFDVVRIEPNGDAVIAGRGAPGAIIDMLRNGEPHARVVADASGLFALVPPPLPPGASEIVLQSIAPDGSRNRSRDSVTVEVAADRKARPLVALTSPDKPTVVLSAPEPEAKPEIAAPVAPPAPPPAPPAMSAAAPPPPVPQPPRPAVRIATVETRGEGRLFVSGQGAPGATIRLYLNDSLIAPGAAAGDGRLSFAIEKGVRPGNYAVRLDDIDPVSGAVKSRAEVVFTVPPLPESAASAALPSAAPTAAEPAPAMPGAAPTASSDKAAVAAVSPSSAMPGAAGPGAASSGSTSAPSQETAAARAPAPGPAASASPQGTAGQAAATAPPVQVGAIVVPEINTAIVSRGDSLWRISRRVYGEGLRYTVIYGANQPQIRDPDLIYPGQVFVVPVGETRQP